MCRWILLTHDRTGNNGFALTQEYLSLMLGITYTRGQMKVLDPEGLIDGSCSCYELMEREMDRIYESPWRELAHREDKKIGEASCVVYVFLFRFDCPMRAIACFAWATCHSAARM